MVQRVNYHQFSGNTVTLGAGGSRVVMGADSGNLKIQEEDYQKVWRDRTSGIHDFYS